MSRQIKNIEDNVGVFRDGRGMRLAADGKALEDGPADVFIQIEAVDDSYWLLTARTARSRAEALAFRNRVVEACASCFGRRG